MPADQGLGGQGLRRLATGGWEVVRPGRGSLGEEGTDERILGSRRFVKRVLREAAQTERIRSRLSRSGMCFDDVVDRAAGAAGLKAGEVHGAGKKPMQVRARALACYWLVERLGMKEVEVARRLGITQPAVSQSMARGRGLSASGRLYSLPESGRKRRIL